MKLPVLTVFLIAMMGIPGLALAQNPPSVVKDPITSRQDRDALQKRLKQAVFIAYAYQNKPHLLYAGELSFDGAVVAVKPQDIREVVPKDVVVEVHVPEAEPDKSHSFFDRGLNYTTSPFQKKPEPQKQYEASSQYYLTTADWLTNSSSIELNINGKRIAARLEYRDDAQNVALLSTPIQSGIEPVDIYPPEEPMPLTAFALLNPNTPAESFTLHSISVTQENLYGRANLVARNGYPLFSNDGRLVALTVGPDISHTTAKIVHPGLINRALYPKKYDRTRIEKVEFKEYSGNHKIGSIPE